MIKKIIITLCLIAILFFSSLIIFTATNSLFLENKIKIIIAAKSEEKINQILDQIPNKDRLISSANDIIKKGQKSIDQINQKSQQIEQKITKINQKINHANSKLGKFEEEIQKISSFLAHIQPDNKISNEIDSNLAKIEEEKLRFQGQLDEIEDLKQQKNQIIQKAQEQINQVNILVNTNYAKLAKEEILQLCSCNYSQEQQQKNIIIFENFSQKFINLDNSSTKILSDLKDLKNNFKPIIKGAYFKAIKSIYLEIQIFSIINIIIFTLLALLAYKINNIRLTIIITLVAFAAIIFTITAAIFAPKTLLTLLTTRILIYIFLANLAVILMFALEILYNKARIIRLLFRIQKIF